MGTKTGHGDKLKMTKNPYKQGILNNLSPFVPVGDVFIGGSYFSYPLSFCFQRGQMGTKVRKSPITRAFRHVFICPRLLQFVPLLVLLNRGCKGKSRMGQGLRRFVPVKKRGDKFCPRRGQNGGLGTNGDKFVPG